jgi:hypothetical protein
MSDNITTLPLLLPSFLCLCTALVFGPVSTQTLTDYTAFHTLNVGSQRFGVMLHRVQSLETPVAPIRPTQNSSTSPNAPANSDVQNTGLEVPPAPSRLETMQREISRHPNLRCQYCTSIGKISILIICSTQGYYYCCSGHS